MGLVAHIKGQRSHQLVADALHVLRRMNHRGACGCEVNTGDGAGILTALAARVPGSRWPRRRFGLRCRTPGAYAAGVVFLPTLRRGAGRVQAGGGAARLRGRASDWSVGGPSRCVRTRRTSGLRLGRACRRLSSCSSRPVRDCAGDAFERQLYLIRKQASHQVHGNARLSQRRLFYVCSLSTQVIIYKGMLTPDQLVVFYPDLSDPAYTTHLAMVHSRFSTNTFPSWDRAQPLRFMSHNGEINTLRGNINWMRAREGVVRGGCFGDDLPPPVSDRRARLLGFGQF